MPKTKTAWVDFKEIKAKVSIVQILEHYGVLETLTRGGNDRLSGACPIHGGTNKTHFRVSTSKNCWNCFGKCQDGGNIIDFVAKKEDVSFRDAALLMRDWFIGEQEEKPMPVQKSRYEASQVEEQPRFRAFDPPLQEKSPVESEAIAANSLLKFELTKLDPAHSYLQERGLTEESIATFGLGYCGKGLLRGYIAIPIHNADGELVAYAGRWPGTPPEVKGKGKYRLPEGFKKSLEVFNLHRAMLSRQDRPLVIVEGFFDCIKVYQAGYERVVALMGSSLSDAQEASILESVDHGAIVFFDNDEAGRKGQVDVVCRLSRNVFVKSALAKGEGAQPEHLSPKEIHALLLG